MRREMENILPHERTLSKWMSTVEAEPGFTKPAFSYVKQEIEKEAKEGKQLLFALSVDEMSIMRKDKNNSFQNQKSVSEIKIAEFPSYLLAMAHYIVAI